MTTFPLPPISLDPVNWSAMILYATTVLLEAEGEPDLGKLGVAWVIRNRMDYQRDTVHEVCLQPMQFSCWNSDYALGRRARLTGIDAVIWDACWKAACLAWWRLGDDPTKGARFYLNPDVTRQLRPLHDLPHWYAEERVTARIGRHAFLVG